jgi:DNA-binding response OmpR family regulator
VINTQAGPYYLKMLQQADFERDISMDGHRVPCVLSEKPEACVFNSMLMDQTGLDKLKKIKKKRNKPC